MYWQYMPTRLRGIPVFSSHFWGGRDGVWMCVVDARARPAQTAALARAASADLT